MPGIRPDVTGQQVYEWMASQADCEGMVSTTAPAVASILKRNRWTISHAMQRLQRRNMIFLIEEGGSGRISRYVIPELCEDGD